MPGPTRFVYWFDEADHSNPLLFGGKGAGLARMTAGGLPVPPGFIITTEACRATQEAGGALPESLLDEVDSALAQLEERSGRRFGGGPYPLLVSVRSGAPISMPGMMDTILNLGLNSEAAAALAQATGDPGFVAEVYQRFHCMFADIVLGADGDELAEVAAEARDELAGATDAAELFRGLRAALQEATDDDVGERVPEEPRDQLRRAIKAVFDSWGSRRAVTYRKAQRISDTLGTAVVVQAMVFGNLVSPTSGGTAGDAVSGSGVAFTRDPSTGEPVLYGEFLEGGQGEDVVAGLVTPAPLAVAAERHPLIFDQFRALCSHLEELYRDVLDIEFTVEKGQLYLLQVRSAKRTAQAAVRIASDFLAAGVYPAVALGPVTLDHVRQAERPRFDAAAVDEARAAGRLLGAGIGACPGQTSGVVVLDPDRAVERAATGEPVILARQTTSPLDLHGMLAAGGIVTALGGATSHAAVVARALGKACVTGCAGLAVDSDARTFTYEGRVLSEGDQISIDGASGEVFAGAIPITGAEGAGEELNRVLGVARDAARCRIYGIATTTAQVGEVQARGAVGIASRISDALATTGRFEEALERIMGQRRADEPNFKGLEHLIAEVLTPILAEAGDCAVAVRAFDLIEEEAAEVLDVPKLLADFPRLAVPLGVPELLRVQVAGLAIAAREAGLRAAAELTVRHITDPNEVTELRRIATAEHEASGLSRVLIGATVTSPRGAARAVALTGASEFVWIDLRRMQAAAFGYPASVFLTAEPLDDYVRRGMLPGDPRLVLDEGMTRMLAQFVQARITHPGCQLGVRLAGPVTDELLGALYRGGFRVFAIDAAEIRAADLALGKAAMEDQGRG